MIGLKDDTLSPGVRVKDIIQQLHSILKEGVNSPSSLSISVSTTCVEREQGVAGVE